MTDSVHNGGSGAAGLFEGGAEPGRESPPRAPLPRPGQPISRWSHVLLELDSLKPLTAPIRSSSRIMYTSLAVSKTYIALGSNVGTLYVYNKSSLKYLFMWPSDKDHGSVSQMAFGPDENLLGYGTSQGYVSVVELNIDKRSKAERIRSTTHHKTSTITTLSWNSEGTKMFTGDAAGRVSVANISTKKHKDLLKLPSEVIMRLDCPVVQIDAFDDKLVVSTTKKTYMGSTTKQQFHQVGQKPRDGQFGCCFYPVSGMVTPVMYSARPGSRLWEVDYEGNVLNTHQFKKLLDIPQLPIVSALEGSYKGIEEIGPGPQNIALPKLLLCGGQYLVSCCHKKLFVFNPAQVQVVLWTGLAAEVLDIKSNNQDIYLLHKNNQVRKVSLFSIPRTTAKLLRLQHYELAAELISAFKGNILQHSARKHLPITALAELANQLPPESSSANQISFMVLQLQAQSEQQSKDDSLYQELESGIFVVKTRSISSGSDETSFNELLLERLNASNAETPGADANEVINFSSKIDVKYKLSGLTTKIKGRLSREERRDGTETSRRESVPQSQDYVLSFHKDAQGEDSRWEIGEAATQEQGQQAAKKSMEESGIQTNQTTRIEEINVPNETCDITDKTDKLPITGSQRVESEPPSQEEMTNLCNTDSCGGRTINPCDVTVVCDAPIGQAQGHDVSYDPISDSLTTDSSGTLTPAEDAGTLQDQVVKNTAVDVEDVSQSISSIRDKETRVTEPQCLQFEDPPRAVNVPPGVELNQVLNVDIAYNGSEPVATPTNKPSPSDSSYESDYAQSAESSVDIPLASNHSNGSHASHDQCATESDVTEPSVLRRANSSESLLSFEQGSEGISSSAGSRRGSFTSLSLSSNELVFGPPTLDPEPVYKQTLGVVQGKGKKKKAKTINLDENDDSSTQRLADATRRRKLRKSKSVSAESRSSTRQGFPTVASEGCLSSLTERTKTKEVLQPTSSSAPTDSQPPTVVLTSALVQGHRETTNRGTPPPSSSPGGGTGSDSNSPSPKLGLMAVKASLSSKAKSLVQTLKEQKEKIHPKKELPEPLDVAAPPADEDGDPPQTQVPSDAESCETETGSVLTQPSHVPLEKLKTATTLARDQLAKHEVLFNSTTMKSTLQEWVVHLNQTLRLLHQHDSQDGSTDQPSLVSIGGERGAVSMSDLEMNHAASAEGHAGQLPEGHTGHLAQGHTGRLAQGHTGHLAQGHTGRLAQGHTGHLASFQHVTDPYGMSAILHCEVTELATLCVEVGIHGDIDDVVTSLVDSLAECPSDNTVTTFTGVSGEAGIKQTVLEDNADDTQGEGQPDEHPNTPEADQETFDTKGEQDVSKDLDLKMARFILCHFHCLDRERLYHAIHQRESPSYQQWLALLQCLLSESENSTEKSLKKFPDWNAVSPSCSALLSAFRLYQDNPTAAVEKCVSLSARLRPLDIIYICQTGSHQLWHPYTSLYVDKYLVSAGRLQSRDAVWQTLLHNKTVAWTVLQSLLEEAPPAADLHCHCGFPRPRSHRLQWKHQELLQEFLDKVETRPDQVSQISQSELLSRLRTAGYWRGCLRLCRKMSPAPGEYLSWVVQLADIGVITNLSSHGLGPNSLDQWEELLKLRAKQDIPLDSRPTEISQNCSTPCLNCGASLTYENEVQHSGGTASILDDDRPQDQEQECNKTSDWLDPEDSPHKQGCDWPFKLKWEELARLLVQSTGVNQGLELLESLSLPAGTLSPTFYQGCVLTHLIAKQQSNLVHHLVGKLDTFLWSHQSSALPTQLVSIIDTEKKDVASGGEVSRATQKMVSEAQIQRALEEPECHWGVNIQADSDCPVCGIPLQHQPQSLSCQLLIFDCGHGYHKTCLQDEDLSQKVCLVCAFKQ